MLCYDKIYMNSLLKMAGETSARLAYSKALFVTHLGSKLSTKLQTISVSINLKTGIIFSPFLLGKTSTFLIKNQYVFRPLKRPKNPIGRSSSS